MLGKLFDKATRAGRRLGEAWEAGTRRCDQTASRWWDGLLRDGRTLRSMGFFLDGACSLKERSDRALEEHWLRVGRTWFIPVAGIHLAGYPKSRWWRPDWVQAGFARYPYNKGLYRKRDEAKMVKDASGTPWEPPFKADLLKVYGAAIVEEFFESHSREKLPRTWQ